MDWVQAASANHAHPQAMRPSGNESLGGTTSPEYVFMLNGWVVEPQDANHTLTIQGNLYPDPDNPDRPLIAYPPGYDVTVVIERSDQAQYLDEIIKAKQAAQGALATNFA